MEHSFSDDLLVIDFVSLGFHVDEAIATHEYDIGGFTYYPAIKLESAGGVSITA